MAFTISGIGTRYQGERLLPDGTYITTKWFVFLAVPIVPLGSYRVVRVEAQFNAGVYSRPYIDFQEVPLDTVMVLRVYAWIMGTPIALFVLKLLYDRFM